ncbi:MAG: CHAT domain-containing protein [Anaerolineae bacterium]|nr:CHAT domain-containing protein [Anaerolineae bacterium]
MADSTQIRAEIVTRLLNDAAFLARFLADPDGVLAEFPGLDKFDGRYLKDKITDWASLTAVAQRFGIVVPERPSAAPESAKENPPRLQMVLHLRDDDAFRDLYWRDAAAAFAAYPSLPEEDAAYIRERFGGETTLQSLIDRFQTTVQSVDLPAPESKGVEPDDELSMRYVNTGFARSTSPAEPITHYNTPLTAAKPHYFWLEIGKLVAGGLAQEAIALPTDKLPPEARLKIALFDFDGEIELTGAEVGEVQLAPTGAIRVTRRADEPAGVSSDLLDRRLFFAVQTMDREGYGRLRCNIYFQNTLVQSHLIVARMSAVPTERPYRMLWHVSDYTLSKSLDSEQLTAMGENSLSIMVNDNGNGTHGFRFVGGQEYKNDATLGEGAITQLQKWVRGALSKAAWGDDEEYKPGKKYQYGGPLDLKKLQADLLSMAINGYRAFDALIGPLVGDADKVWDVMDWMVKPGQVQIATKEAAQLVIPAAMFYDYPFLDGNAPGDYSLCPEFVAALKSAKPLEECACFQGSCPSYGQELVVCPSGFWGFRHYLGLPMSVKSAPDAPLKIGGGSPPRLAVSVSTDKNFVERPSHEQRLQQMGVGWEYADSRDEALDMLKATESQIVYFYCHGGLTDKGFPYLSLGSTDSDWFTRGNLRARRIRWQKVRPLVFINGCHTTQITPERALDFVSGFVETSGAAGVIGTEITIFEPIATQFAEECLRRFLFEKQTLGEAVRGARLHMLKNGNPLGLVYIPYALPALKLA